ncbi:polyketide cyclase / dehydrase and lipid transport family protein [Blastomonas sp. RAC04]|uniref:SRPBCC family protein n=1 Tax=Blastomonas TaxID=150203 RepID=UPI00083DE6BB|nr:MULTISPECIES: SRPBCC family protein [unclassified Blastomonas]AOG00189.1 polyketide cyclase / dehydrase and lipid transport family protein [Blastomonas sp. RAC04]
MRTALAVLALATLAAAPAHAEVTAQSDNGFAVKHSVTVAVDPDAAFAMLRTPAKWWDKDHTWTGSADNLYMDAQAGGCFCELIPNEATTESGAPQRTLRGSVQHMQILYVDPGKLLRLSGALGPLQGEAMAGTMTVSLAPIKGGTRLTFEYVAGGFMRMPQGEMAPAVDGVIGAQASRLAMALGPLVGGGGAEAPATSEPEPEPEPAADTDAAADDAGGSVSSLVADLEPDDAVSAGKDEEPVAKPAAKPAVKPGPAAGTRPLARPSRDRDPEEGGR